MILTVLIAEDEAEASRIQAKNGLESYTYSLCNSLSDVKTKLPDKSSEIAALETKIDECIKWLDESQAATKEYEERRKEIEEESTSLMKAFYKQGDALGGTFAMGRLNALLRRLPSPFPMLD